MPGLEAGGLRRRQLLTLAAAGAVAPYRSWSQVAVLAVDGGQRIELASRLNGRAYTLWVRIPREPPPRPGFPVLFVLDGQSMFFTAIDATRNLAPRGCIIVGIGYPTDSPEFAAKITGLPGRTEDGAPDPRTVRAAIQMLRNHDLTLPATTDFVARRPGYGITVDNVGGADTFIDVLIREIRPLVESLAPVAPGNQALFGHSFGGLVVLRALFRRPEAFRSFIAASPSIYWNDFAVLADEPAYSKRVRSGEITPRVLITVGGAESDLAPSAGPEQVAQVRLKRTVASAVGLAARLSALPGRPPYVTQGVVFDGEGHVSTQQAAMSRGVAFAFQDDRNAD